MVTSGKVGGRTTSAQDWRKICVSAFSALLRGTPAGWILAKIAPLTSHLLATVMTLSTPATTSFLCCIPPHRQLTVGRDKLPCPCLNESVFRFHYDLIPLS